MPITANTARDILTGSAAAPRSNADIPVTSWYLENTQETLGNGAARNAFYLLLASDAGHCIWIWGRIGSKGQAKIQKFPSLGDAESACLQQMYKKQGRGYDLREKLPFVVKASELQSVLDGGAHESLMAARRQALHDPQFTGEQQTATRHYDTFIQAAEALMGRVSRSKDPFSLLEEWTALQEAWGTLHTKHEMAATTLELTGQMIQQKVFA